MANRDSYQQLIEKLDQFIRKYYINQVIRGALYSLGLILVLFLAINVLEYYSYFDTTGRKVLFFSFLGISAVALYAWVLHPLFRYFQLGKRISHEQAASIIGDHFANVKDKLLNILQLKKQADQSQQDTSLLLASINQKTEEIRPVPFKAAIDLGQNRRYLKYALPPLLLLLVLLWAAPSLILDSTERLIYNGREFLRPAPFQFVIDESELSVAQFNDYPLTIDVTGDQLPNEVFIEIDGYQYRAQKKAPNQFEYVFKNVQDAVRFQLRAGEVSSITYSLDVLRKPNITDFEIKVDYPAYTGRSDESLNNIGDLTVPVGTELNWVFNTENTDRIEVQFSDEEAPQELRRFSDDLFTTNRRILEALGYKLFASNTLLPRADSVGYRINVIPDLYPEIKVERFQDSTQRKVLFFAGDASDDYGLSRLRFAYQVIRENEGPEETIYVPISNPGTKQTRYDYIWDLTELELNPGDQISYYFEVFDNDGVNGAKSARTGLMTFAVPTKEEIAAKAEANDNKIKDDLEQALRESDELQEELKRLREKLLQEKEVDWKTRKELEKLLQKQQEIERKINEAQKAFQENLQNEEEFRPSSPEVEEKQERLEKLFEEAAENEEMRKLMEQIEELMQELEKEDALEMMEDFQFNDEEMEMEIDRLLELFKQLELEKEMQETMDDLEELAEQQEQLSEQTQEESLSQEQLQEEQQKINDQFDQIQERLEQTEQKNQELQSPTNLDTQEEQQDAIQEELNNSKEQLRNQENQKAAQSQQKASQKMREMSSQMQQSMSGMQQQQMQEDINSLRQLLENLVGLSFDQEELIDNFEQAEINTPRYVELVQEQFKLQEDFRLVEDSLQALAKRVFQIESFVTEKVSDIKGEMRSTVEELEERRQPQAAEHQQRAMTNLNDLALMLSETMENMQQQMSSMMSAASCPKPGQQSMPGQQPKDKISQGQQQLNQEMQNMQQRMERGGERATSKEFAQMAAKQAALRRALEQKQQQLREQGKGSKELQDMIEGMDRVEEELVNKRLTTEMLNRQQQILSRLLEYEKAERERQLDEQRKSETAEQRERKMPPSMEEYIRQREAEVEMFKRVSPTLKPYYKRLVDEYFQSLRSESE